jgi:hypothetical protein
MQRDEFPQLPFVRIDPSREFPIIKICPLEIGRIVHDPTYYPKLGNFSNQSGTNNEIIFPVCIANSPTDRAGSPLDPTGFKMIWIESSGFNGSIRPSADWDTGQFLTRHKGLSFIRSYDTIKGPGSFSYEKPGFNLETRRRSRNAHYLDGEHTMINNSHREKY